MTEEIAPLTPENCDLRGLEYMPLLGQHLFGSEFNARATDTEWRAAMTLWWAAWTQQPAASLPDDDIALCRLADLGRDSKTWRKIKQMALYGFTKCSDGRLYHPVLAKQALVAWDKRVKERQRKAEWRAKKQGQDADVPRDMTGTEQGQDADGDADVPADGTRRDVTGRDNKEEKKNLPLTPSGFVGRTIKLDEATLGQWQQRYSCVPDLVAELSTLDEWLQQAAPSKRENWRATICNTLNRKHQEAAAGLAKARVNGNVTDDGWELPVC